MPKSNTPRPWTKTEENYLLRNVNKLSAKEIAVKLGRPYGGVVWKKNQLKERDIAFVPTLIAPPAYNPPQPSFWSRVKEFFT